MDCCVISKQKLLIVCLIKRFSTGLLKIMAAVKRGLQSCISEKWKLDKLYCDIEVTVQDYHFPCHRFILSACSGYFDSALKSNLVKNGQLEIKSMSHETFGIILNDIYSDETSFGMDTIDDVWQATHKLDIAFYLAKCETFVIESINVGNYIPYYNLAVVLNSERVIAASLTFMKKNFELFYKTEDFLDCPCEMITNFVTDQDLIVDSEDSVLHSILLWTANGQRGNTSDRQLSLVKLLQASKIELASKVTLENLIIHPFIINTPTAVEIVHEALKYKWGKYSVFSQILIPLRHCTGKTNAMVYIKENAIQIFDLNSKLKAKVTLDKLNGYSNDNVTIVSMGDRLCVTCTNIKKECPIAGQAHKCRTTAVVLIDEQKNISTLYESCGYHMMPENMLFFDHKCLNISTSLNKCIVLNKDLFINLVLKQEENFESAIAVDKQILLFSNSDTVKLNINCYDTETRNMVKLDVPVNGPAKNILTFFKGTTQLILIPNGSLMSVKKNTNNEVILTFEMFLWQNCTSYIQGIVCFNDELMLFTNNKTGDLDTKILKQTKFTKISIVQNDLDGSNSVPMIIPQGWMS